MLDVCERELERETYVCERDACVRETYVRERRMCERDLCV